MDQEKPWLVKDAAAFLSRSEGAIRNMVLRKQIPFVKKAGPLYFFQSDLIAWLRQGPGVTLEELKEE
jgi:hypothetical protein